MFMINASHVATCLGVNPYCIRESTCLLNSNKSAGEKHAMEMGKQLEPMVKRMYLSKWSGPLHEQSNSHVRAAYTVPIRGVCDILLTGKIRDQSVRCIVELKTSKYQRRKLLQTHFIQTLAYMQIYLANWGEVAVYHKKSGTTKLFFIRPSQLIIIFQRLLHECSRTLREGYLQPLNKMQLVRVRQLVKSEMERCIVLVQDEKHLMHLRRKNCAPTSHTLENILRDLTMKAGKAQG